MILERRPRVIRNGKHEFHVCFFGRSDEDLSVILDRTNSKSPFYGIHGNDDAIEEVCDILYQGLRYSGEEISDSIILTGPPGCGKTHLARAIARATDHAYVETDATQFTNNGELIEKVVESLIKIGDYNEPQMNGGVTNYNNNLPFNVFIDEIHALNRKCQDGLLKATERSDGMLIGDDIILNCQNAFWIFATTDYGKICPALKTRFKRIHLERPSNENIAKVIAAKMNWDFDISQEVVRFGGSSLRESIQFANSVEIYANRRNIHLLDALEQVRKRKGIDEYGYYKNHLKILLKLSKIKKGCILRDLALELDCTSEEVINDWMPKLILDGLVEFSGKYTITSKGKMELTKKGMCYEEVL